jgi:hypothetical protein
VERKWEEPCEQPKKTAEEKRRARKKGEERSAQ